MTAQPVRRFVCRSERGRTRRSQTNRKVRLAGIAALAQAQERVVSRRQLRALGWSDNQIDHEIRYGRWHAPAWGVVALQNAPLTYDQRLWLGVLHAGDGAVLTHLTSCRRAGLAWKGDDEDTIHVLTTKGDLVDPIQGFFFHQTRRPYGRWVRPVPSGPPRLPIEHGALLTAERDRYVRRAVGLLAACVQQRLTTADRLIVTAQQIRKLRHGADLPPAARRHRGWRPVVRRDRCRTPVRACWPGPANPPGRAYGQRRPTAIPGLRVAAAGRPTGRPGGGWLLPPAGRQLVERHET